MGAGGDGRAWSWGWCPRGAHGTSMPWRPPRGRVRLLRPHTTGHRGHKGPLGPAHMACPARTAPHRLGGRRGPGARDGSGPETSPLVNGLALQGAPLGADPSCRTGRPLTRLWQPAAPCVPPARPPRGPGRRGRQGVWRRAGRRQHGGWASRGFPGACRRGICRVRGPPCLGVVPSRPQGLTLGFRRHQWPQRGTSGGYWWSPASRGSAGTPPHLDADPVVVLPARHSTIPCNSPMPPYWITSSAWKRRVGGIVRPSALAALRLMTNSNFIGCSTGRSPGLVPFRILST